MYIEGELVWIEPWDGVVGGVCRGDIPYEFFSAPREVTGGFSSSSCFVTGPGGEHHGGKNVEWLVPYAQMRPVTDEEARVAKGETEAKPTEWKPLKVGEPGSTLEYEFVEPEKKAEEAVGPVKVYNLHKAHLQDRPAGEMGEGACFHCEALMPRELASQIFDGERDCPYCGWRSGRCHYCKGLLVMQWNSKEGKLEERCQDCHHLHE